MPPSNESPRSFLYQSGDKTINLIDIPRSISEAQGTAEDPCMDLLCSVPPLEKPYPSIEPRSQKARQQVTARLPPEDSVEQSFPQALLIQGLSRIRAEHPYAFCSDRTITPPESTNRKRKHNKSGKSQLVEDSNEEREKRGSSIEKRFVAPHVFEPRKPLTLPSDATINGYEVGQITDIANGVIRNPFAQPARLIALDLARGYRIPPSSTFMLSQVGQRGALLFKVAAYKLFPEPSMSAAPGQFDFILLDPPWDNKSARRSNHYKTIRKAEEDPLEILVKMLGPHIAPGGIVACWKTNKTSVRDTALQAFEAWGVRLVEEWAWLKTTIHGDPVCAIDGIMRRPYEVLLVGRQVDLAIDGIENSASDEPIKYRLIVGVPDLHSRKPCLKKLIEPMLKDSSDYRALEIFARNLTAGWWSWGDEVLKYNWEGYWANAEPLNTT